MFETIPVAQIDRTLATIDLAQVRFAVFRLRYPEATDGIELDRLAMHISQEERNSLEQIPSPERRLEFAASRALRRRIVGTLLDVAPEKLIFRTTAEGKPILWREQTVVPPLFFNYTHDATQILLAVTHQGPIGVDVEVIADYKEAIAKRFYHPAEYMWLRDLPPSEQAAGFYHLWVIKEACVKAHGTGLQLLRHVRASPATQGTWKDVEWRVLSVSEHIAAAVAIVLQGDTSPPEMGQCYDLAYTWLLNRGTFLDRIALPSPIRAGSKAP
jgi:phosphopantetheine--protein transferase-like protein